jgi:large subunit ribosomal protein L10
MISRQKKQNLIKEFEDKIEKQKVMIFCDFGGVKTKELENLRERLKSMGEELKVIKKTLFSIALQRKNLNLDISKWQGQLLVVFGQRDEIGLMNFLSHFEKEHQKFKVLGGILKDNFLEKEKISELSEFQSKENLMRRFLSSLSAPYLSLHRVLKYNLCNFLFVLSKLKVQNKQ